MEKDVNNKWTDLSSTTDGRFMLYKITGTELWREATVDSPIRYGNKEYGGYERYSRYSDILIERNDKYGRICRLYHIEDLSADFTKVHTISIKRGSNWFNNEDRDALFKTLIYYTPGVKFEPEDGVIDWNGECYVYQRFKNGFNCFSGQRLWDGWNNGKYRNYSVWKERCGSYYDSVDSQSNTTYYIWIRREPLSWFSIWDAEGADPSKPVHLFADRFPLWKRIYVPFHDAEKGANRKTMEDFESLCEELYNLNCSEVANKYFPEVVKFDERVKRHLSEYVKRREE